MNPTQSTRFLWTAFLSIFSIWVDIVTQGHWKWHHLLDRIQVSIGVPQTCGPILWSFRDTPRYWSKIAIFSERYAVNAPLLRSQLRLSVCLWRAWAVSKQRTFCRMFYTTSKARDLDRLWKQRENIRNRFHQYLALCRIR